MDTKSAAPLAQKAAVAAEPGAEPVQPDYRTTFFFVATMLAGFIVGWVLLLGLLLRRF